MLSRKEQSEVAMHLPEAWTNQVIDILNQTYKDKCEAINRIFEVFGWTYPNELYLTISLIHPEDTGIMPVTYTISADLDEKNSPDKLLNPLVDSIGLFFDGYFADPNWNEYVSNWTEAEFKGVRFHYKVSRENVALTLIAEKLLSEDQ